MGEAWTSCSTSRSATTGRARRNTTRRAGPPDDPYAAITAQAADALRGLGPVRRAIELGAGTGQFTGVVAGLADRVTAVDSSPEALELNRTKIPASNVERVAANVFEWTPPEPADLVLFACLLSHIPTDRLEPFMDAVGRMLAPDGRAFVIDESPHGQWQEEAADDPGGEIVYRTLTDGRRFRIVKILWEPAELAERLRSMGWVASLTRRDPFYWGAITRAAPRADPA